MSVSDASDKKVKKLKIRCRARKTTINQEESVMSVSDASDKKVKKLKILGVLPFVRERREFFVISRKGRARKLILDSVRFRVGAKYTSDLPTLRIISDLSFASTSYEIRCSVEQHRRILQILGFQSINPEKAKL